MRSRNAGRTGSQSLTRGINVTGPVKVRRNTEFSSVPKGVETGRVTLGEKEVQFILVCALGFLWRVIGLGDRGRLRLFGDGVKRRRERGTRLLRRGVGLELGEGVI